MAEIKIIKYTDNLKTQHDSALDSVKMASFLTANYELTDLLLGALVSGVDANTAHHHDGRYFREDEHIAANTGIAAQPIVTDAGGKISNTLLDVPGINSLLSHSALLNLNADDHVMYTRHDGSRPFTGNQSMGGFELVGLAAPSATDSATNRAYVDSQDAFKVAKSGDSMTGILAMGLNKITGLADGTVSGDAVHWQQLETVRQNLETALGAAINGLEWRPGVFLVSSDAELIAATEGALLSVVLPFSDDDAPTLLEADIPVGALLLSKNATPKLFKVYDDAGVKKLTLINIVQPAIGHAFICKFDLPDAPGSQESRAIYTFDGTDLIKIADVDWGMADGIDLTSGYAMAVLNAAIVAGDSVQQAISKLDKKMYDAEQELTSLDGRLDAAELLLNTPLSRTRYVSKNGNDTNSGSLAKPFLTIAAAQASITDAYFNSVSDFKRYVIVIAPGVYIENTGFEFKTHVTYVGEGSRAAVSVSVASGNMVWNVPEVAGPKINFLNMAIFSPIVINQNNSVNSGTFEAYHLYVTSPLTVNNTGTTAAIDLQIRYSRLGNIVTSGFVNSVLEYCTHGGIVYGSGSATSFQGNLTRKGTVGNVGTNVTANAASLYFYNSYTHAIIANDLGLAGSKFIQYTVDSLRQGSLSVTGTTYIITRLSDIRNIAYVPTVAGNWASPPVEGMGALDELASRVKTIESEGGKPKYVAGAGGISKGQLVYISGDNTVLPYSDISVMRNVVGIALATVSAGADILVAKGDALVAGILSAATFGDEVYWTGTGFSSTAPAAVGSYVWMAGVAKNATDLSAEVQHLYTVS